MQYDPYRAAGCAQQVCWLPLERISPRPSLETEAADGMPLSELAESIRCHGLTVQRAPGGRYVVVSGNRRLMACRLAGLTHVDAVVLAGVAQEQDARPLLEAVLSGHLHYLEEAGAMRRLQDEFGLSREEIARYLGCTAATVGQKLRLTELDEELQRFLMEHGLSERHARALLKLPDRRGRMAIARQAVREGLCVRDVELMVSSALARLPVPPVAGGRTIALVRDHRLYLNAIRAIVAQMREAGIDAQATERSLGDCVPAAAVPSGGSRHEKAGKRMLSRLTGFPAVSPSEARRPASWR